MRRKLTIENRRKLYDMCGKISQRKAAQFFGVSRRLVTFVWYPERAKKSAKQLAERRKDGRYSMKKYETRESWAKRQRELKNRKYRLYKDKLKNITMNTLPQIISSSIRESIADTKDFNWSASERLGFKEGIYHVVDNLASAIRSNDATFDSNKFISDTLSDL